MLSKVVKLPKTQMYKCTWLAVNMYIKCSIQFMHVFHKPAKSPAISSTVYPLLIYTFKDSPQPIVIVKEQNACSKTCIVSLYQNK